MKTLVICEKHKECDNLSCIEHREHQPRKIDNKCCFKLSMYCRHIRKKVQCIIYNPKEK